MPVSQFVCRILQPRVVTPVSLRSLTNSAFRGTEHNDSGHSGAPAEIASPDPVSAANANFKPTDPVQDNRKKMTTRTKRSGVRNVELGVGEIEGITFKVEPLRRQGEDIVTMRARLLCLSFLDTLFWCSDAQCLQASNWLTYSMHIADKS
jgi:hypothetical protein